MNDSPVHYIAGVCNIGRGEIRVRKLIGWTMAVSTVLLALVLFVVEWGRAWRLLVFFPAFGSAMGFLQAYSGFCAGFGLRGVFNLTDRAGRLEPVRDSRARKRDRMRALRMILVATAVAAIAGAAAFLVPA